MYTHFTLENFFLKLNRTLECTGIVFDKILFELFLLTVTATTSGRRRCWFFGTQIELTHGLSNSTQAKKLVYMILGLV